MATNQKVGGSNPSWYAKKPRMDISILVFLRPTRVPRNPPPSRRLGNRFESRPHLYVVPNRVWCVFASHEGTEKPTSTFSYKKHNKTLYLVQLKPTPNIYKYRRKNLTKTIDKPFHLWYNSRTSAKGLFFRALCAKGHSLFRGRYTDCNAVK